MKLSTREPKARWVRRVTGRTLLREFERGLSCLGLARKWGLTNVVVQQRIRQEIRRQRDQAWQAGGGVASLQRRTFR